jgi:hypothetical protein
VNQSNARNGERPFVAVRVAAWHPRLLDTGSMMALGLIQRQIERCESEGVTVGESCP